MGKARLDLFLPFFVGQLRRHFTSNLIMPRDEDIPALILRGDDIDALPHTARFLCVVNTTASPTNNVSSLGGV